MTSYVTNLPVIAIIVPFVMAFIIGLTGNKNLKLKKFLSLLATLISLVAVLLLIKPIMVNKNIATYWMGNWKPVEGWAIGIGLEVDALSLFVGLIIAVTCFLSSIYSIRYMERDNSLEKYYTLFLLLAGSMLGFVFTGDLFNMYVMLEIMTFAAVALTAFRNKTYKAIEAGFKYIVIGSLGSSLILIGTVLLYAQVNTLNMAQISAVIYNNDLTPVTIMALTLLLTGYAVKAFLVPCHTWPPDAHMSAPSSISMLLSGVMSKTGVYGIIRILYMLFHASGKTSLAALIITWGTITMLVGVTMALVQTDFKRLLAFHSVSQLGYIMVGLGVGLVSTNEIAVLGALGGLYHMLNHATFKCLLFLTAGAVLYTTGTTDLDKLGGLGKKMPLTTVLFMIGAAAISGIPPFNGFVSKWLIYQASYEAGYYWVTIAALLVSVMTLASFVKVGQSVFFGQRHKDYDNVKDVPWTMRIPMIILSLICVIGGLFPRFISKYLLEPTAYAMYNLGGYIEVMFGKEFVAKMFKSTVTIPEINYSYAG
ncbi:proton-conducting transporter membrane subunit, partial [Clostridium polynesiense]|uniref:proton-conducting transporter transmembrane domain-containing protein n=1 Tax=Clostridium polynesiense TaxID=1325933 RepID=UPI00069362DC